MARILRGDIVWADLDPVRGHEQAGKRPVVVLSEDVFNARTGTVTAMAIPGAFIARTMVHRLPLKVHTAILDAVVIAGGAMMLTSAVTR